MNVELKATQKYKIEEYYGSCNVGEEKQIIMDSHTGPKCEKEMPTVRLGQPARLVSVLVTCQNERQCSVVQ